MPLNGRGEVWTYYLKVTIREGREINRHIVKFALSSLSWKQEKQLESILYECSSYKAPPSNAICLVYLANMTFWGMSSTLKDAELISTITSYTSEMESKIINLISSWDSYLYHSIDHSQNNRVKCGFSEFCATERNTSEDFLFLYSFFIFLALFFSWPAL